MQSRERQAPKRCFGLRCSRNRRGCSDPRRLEVGTDLGRLRDGFTAFSQGRWMDGARRPAGPSRSGLPVSSFFLGTIPTRHRAIEEALDERPQPGKGSTGDGEGSSNGTSIKTLARTPP